MLERSLSVHKFGVQYLGICERHMSNRQILIQCQRGGQCFFGFGNATSF